MNDGRMSITDVAVRIGVTPKTIVRWERAKKSDPGQTRLRGWRVYDKEDLKRLINTIGFLGHVFPGEFIGPGPTASADLSELTPSTLPMITICISKILEDLTVFPDLLKRLLPHISTIQFEIATGLNLPCMGDEAERDAFDNLQNIKESLMQANPQYTGDLRDKAVNSFSIPGGKALSVLRTWETILENL
jgi:transcriptional regulator with XRE-family HTH domain